MPLAMEKVLKGGREEKGYTYTIIRPSLLNDDTAPERKIREGIDGDFPIGYAISRDDTGRWIYDNILDQSADQEKYENNSRV